MSGGRLVRVETTATRVEVSGVVEMNVDEAGVLWLSDSDGAAVALYAAGFWRSGEVVAEREVEGGATGLGYRGG